MEEVQNYFQGCCSDQYVLNRLVVTLAYIFAVWPLAVAFDYEMSRKFLNLQGFAESMYVGLVTICILIFEVGSLYIGMDVVGKASMKPDSNHFVVVNFSLMLFSWIVAAFFYRKRAGSRNQDIVLIFHY